MSLQEKHRHARCRRIPGPRGAQRRGRSQLQKRRGRDSNPRSTEPPIPVSRPAWSDRIARKYGARIPSGKQNGKSSSRTSRSSTVRCRHVGWMLAAQRTVIESFASRSSSLTSRIGDAVTIASMPERSSAGRRARHCLVAIGIAGSRRCGTIALQGCDRGGLARFGGPAPLGLGELSSAALRLLTVARETAAAGPASCLLASSGH